MGRIVLFILAFFIGLSSTLVWAQENDVPQTIASPDSTDTLPLAELPPAEEPIKVPSVIIPKLTVVEIEILDPLNSKTSKMDEMFDIQLAEPIVIEDEIIIPAGTPGRGQVVHAAKARAAGKAGEMILAARYLDFQGQKIKLRSFRFGSSTGKSNADEAMAAGMIVAAPLTLFISGGNVDVPVGSLAHAKTAWETEIILEGEE